ncbi:hypothetical protein Tco_0857931 [Tanacetum coccineum]|uniref:Uncharacterized protein n=1 Tax=Tanacetum coccineum TaxID=301880 RepID=A0ABQ5BBT7_9ASTR
MYLTASRPDIMFAVCACSRFQVTPKSSHLSAIKRIFRYLKGKPKLGLWYPRVSSFDLESYSDSDYAGANLDRKSTIGALISLLTTISLSTTMAVLDSCPKHNMVAYLEKSEGNVEFHEIIDFLKRSSIHHALTYKFLLVSTTFVEQFWTSAKSKIINNVRHITTKVAGKPVSISEASIRKTSGGNLGGHSSSDKSLSGNEGEMTLQSVYDLCLSLCAQVSDQAKEIQHLKAQIKKLKKQAKPVIHHHRAWLKSVSLKQRLTRKSFPKKQRVHKESVSKQGRKFAKGEPSVQRDPLFDELPEDTVDHMETENAQDVGRTREIVDEEKELDEDILSTEDVLSTDKEKVYTDRQIEGTDEQIEGTEEQIKSTDGQRKGTEDHTEEAYLYKSLLTLKPLPKIDPKDKGKKKIEEEDESESKFDGILEAEKKFKQLASDEKMARKIQEE